jgi:hypothetical protein
MIYFPQENCMYSTNVPRRLLLVVLTVATVFLIGLPAYAQQDQGRIGGVVKDANGAVVPGASVLMKNERTGEERTATSTDSGSYIVSDLRPSVYTITASAQNLNVRATSIQLLAAQRPHGASRRVRHLLWSRTDRGSDSADRERSNQLDLHD